MPIELLILPVLLYPWVAWFSIRYASRYEFYPSAKRSRHLYNFIMTFFFMIYPMLLCLPLARFLPSLTGDDEAAAMGTIGLFIWFSYGYVSYEAILALEKYQRWEIAEEGKQMAMRFTDSSEAKRVLTDELWELRRIHGIGQHSSKPSYISWEELKKYLSVKIAVDLAERR